VSAAYRCRRVGSGLGDQFGLGMLAVLGLDFVVVISKCDGFLVYYIYYGILVVLYSYCPRIISVKFLLLKLILCDLQSLPVSVSVSRAYIYFDTQKLLVLFMGKTNITS